MNTVIYKSTRELECKCDADVIICVDADLTSVGAPFIEGTLTSTTTGIDACLNTVYSYYLSYDETQLADQSYALLNSDINGVICRGCLTDYIDWLFQQANPQ